jgi:hypothetical protein
MAENFGDSSQMLREFDLVEEMEKTLDEVEKAFEIDEIEVIPDKLSYLRFLVKDLDDVLSGENEPLRYRRFTIKRGN